MMSMDIGCAIGALAKENLNGGHQVLKKTASINAADLQVLLYQGLPHVSQMSAPFKSVRIKED